MKLNASKLLVAAILLIVPFALPTAAQNTRVDVVKHSRIPKSCELVTPADISDPIDNADVQALVKEAICKGAGDMLGEYTYTVNSITRAKDKKGKVKEEETFVYEVFFPTLKSGARTRGVQVVTSHNGVPVPPEKLEKERLRAAERIEKEEERITRETPLSPPSSNPSSNPQGMRPLGMYTRSSINRSALGVKSGGLTLAIASFLRTSDLKLNRREQIGGRETLIFNFTPRAGTQFIDNEKYMAQLTGEIWIDATDRIVNRLIGWPSNVTEKANTTAPSNEPAGEKPPVVYVELMRLPEKGVWLPRVIRMNGADYQRLFDGIKTDSISTYSNYVLFSSEVKDAEVRPPGKP